MRSAEVQCLSVSRGQGQLSGRGGGDHPRMRRIGVWEAPERGGAWVWHEYGCGCGYGWADACRKEVRDGERVVQELCKSFAKQQEQLRDVLRAACLLVANRGSGGGGLSRGAQGGKTRRPGGCATGVSKQGVRGWGAEPRGPRGEDETAWWVHNWGERLLGVNHQCRREDRLAQTSDSERAGPIVLCVEVVWKMYSCLWVFRVNFYTCQMSVLPLCQYYHACCTQGIPEGHLECSDGTTCSMCLSGAPVRVSSFMLAWRNTSRRGPERSYLSSLLSMSVAP